MGEKTSEINKSNNFGFLRLLFAYLVILSHSPVLIDGSDQRELLYSLTSGALTFGALAVDGFFLISGYLICQSFEHSKSVSNYFLKRILRIYPAFIVIWLVSLFIVTPLAGYWHLVTSLNLADWARNLLKMAILSQPHLENFAFKENLVTLNGSMWTIRYEFLCYLLIPLIALIGLSKKNVVILTLLALAANLYTRFYGHDFVMHRPFPLSLHLASRLGFAFLIGICFYKFKGYLIWSRKIVFICFVLLLLLAQLPHMAEVSLVLFGSYLMFNFAFNFKNPVTQGVGIKNDISYGVYLYAWPVQGLLIQHYQNIGPWQLTGITIIVVSILGLISWKLVEKPCLNLKQKTLPKWLNFSQK